MSIRVKNVKYLLQRYLDISIGLLGAVHIFVWEKASYTYHACLVNVSGLLMFISNISQAKNQLHLAHHISQTCLRQTSNNDMQSNAYLRTTQIISSTSQKKVRSIWYIFCISQANLSQISGIYHPNWCISKQCQKSSAAEKKHYTIAITNQPNS